MTDDSLHRWISAGYTAEQARQIIEYLRSERRRLERAPRVLIGAAAEKQNIPRFARNVVQRKIKALRRYRPRNLPPLVLAAKFAPNSLLDGLYPARARQWTPVLRRPHQDELLEFDLKNFSFVDNPLGTMTALAKIVEIECTYARARLNFLDQECLDIGSYLILQAVRQQMAPVFEGGRLGLAAQKVIDAVGLRGALNMAPFRGVKDHNDIWPFPLQIRRAGRARSAGRLIAPQKKEHVADGFVETVNQWLRVVATQRLTLEGRRLVLKVIGEVLDNAERHSVPGSDDGDWAVTGYLSRALVGGANRYRCHLAFLSLGETIAQSIATSPRATLENMNAYVQRHRGVSPELLRTVFALQDGVTKDANAAAECRGGTGFQDILEFFGDLGGSHSPINSARLAIVSGSACVQAFRPYICGARKGGMASERQLWFNHQNDPTYPPETAHVFTLPNRLNGTLVTMVIDLDTAYLEETAHAAS